MTITATEPTIYVHAEPNAAAAPPYDHGGPFAATRNIATPIRLASAGFGPAWCSCRSTTVPGTEMATTVPARTATPTS